MADMPNEVVSFSTYASFIFIDLVDPADRCMVGVGLADSIYHGIANHADALPK